MAKCLKGDECVLIGASVSDPTLVCSIVIFHNIYIGHRYVYP